MNKRNGFFKDIDLGVAVITGRYPENGFCVNTISKC